MDEFDIAWAELDSTSPSADVFEIAWQEAPEPQSRMERIASGVLTAGNSALFGFGDEIGSYGAAVVDEARETLGLIPERDFLDRQESYQSTARSALGQFREENPGTALALDVGGGAVTGGLGATRAGVFRAPSLAQSLTRGAAVGAGQGAVAGAGYADDADNRLSGATQGAAIGAGLGLGVGGFTSSLSKIGKTRTAGQLRDRFAKSINSELGVMPGGGGLSPERLSRAQKAVLKTFESASDDQILKAAERLESAANTNTPITLFEALDVPQGYIDAKTVRMSRGGADVAENFLQERRKDVGFRIGEILNEISPEESAYVGSAQLQEGATGLVDQAKKVRAKAVKPIYEQATWEAPVIRTKKVEELLELPPVKTVLQDRRAKFPREIPAELPDNHITVLDQVKRGLDDEIGAAKASAQNDYARALGEIKGELVREIDSFTPSYEQARNQYGRFSKAVERLEGGKWGDRRTYGLLEDVLKANPEKAGAAARRLLQKSPDQLKAIRQEFAKGGPEALSDFRAGIRAAFQEELDRVNTGVLSDKGGAVIDRIFGKSNTRQKLAEALGEEETANIFRTIDLEGLIAKGEGNVGVDLKSFGSPSLPVLKASGEQKGILRKILTQSPTTSLRDIFASLAPNENEQFMKELAEELFSTPDPKKFRELAKLQLAYNKWTRDFDAFTSAAQAAGTSGGTTAAAPKPSGEAGAIDPALALSAGGGASLAVLAARNQFPGASSEAQPYEWRDYLNLETPEGSQSPGVENTTSPQNQPTAEPSQAPLDRTSVFAAPSDDNSVFYQPTSSRTSVFDTGEGVVREQDIAAIEQLIDQDPIDSAIYEAESGRDPLAKNKESSASGGFQLIRQTAKNLGVEDVFDLGQSYEGYKKLRQEYEQAGFNDANGIYAAHYLGVPLLKKWLNGGNLTDKETAQVKYLKQKALPRFQKIYQRIIAEREGGTVA